jgi:sigma-E factor negative regulatory protein RseB
MRWHVPRPWVGLALVAVLTAVLGAARGAPVEGPVAAADAGAWITRIHNAATKGNYQGTMVVSAEGALSSSRVAHYVVGDQVHEQLEALDGRQQRITRHNDLVQTVWPQTRTAVLEKRETPAAWSATPLSVQPQAIEQYAMRREADGRVAGRDAAVLLLEPRDGLRHAQRLWADLATGLLLRADVLGSPAGAAVSSSARTVLESTAFSEVAIGVKPPPDVLAQPLKTAAQLDGYRVIRPQQRRTALDSEGWLLANPVPGFALAGCVRRGMEASGDDASVLQAVFADGLTHVSVFVESYNPARPRTEIQASHGATATLSQRRGEHWVTVVGDAPLATLKLFALTLDRRKP